MYLVVLSLKPILISNVNGCWATCCVTLCDMHLGKLMAAKLEYDPILPPPPHTRTHTRTHTHAHTQTYFHLLRIVSFSLPPVCGVNDLGDESLQTLSVVSLCW